MQGDDKSEGLRFPRLTKVRLIAASRAWMGSYALLPHRLELALPGVYRDVERAVGFAAPNLP
jgi:hypothetical protein